MGAAADSIRSRWAAPSQARRYASGRFTSRRAAQRDVRIVRSLLDRHAESWSRGRLLDVPCGAGRLATALCAAARAYVGADATPAMLAHGSLPWLPGEGAGAGRPSARRTRPPASLVAAAESLPFSDRSFDAVVCCRLFHHLATDAERGQLLAELARVARGLIVLSFWDAASWQAWRRRLGIHRPRAHGGRHALTRAHIGRLLGGAGLRPVAFRATCRYVSLQTFVAAVKARP